MLNYINFKSILIILLLAGGLSIYAQEYEYVEGSGTKEKQIIKEENTAITKELKKQGMTKEDLNGMLEELKKHNPEDLEKIQSGDLSEEEAAALMQKAFSSLPAKVLKKYTGDRGGSLDEKTEKAMNAGLDSFRNVPYDVAYGHIKARVEQSKAAPLFKRIPKSYTFLTKFLRDDEAPKMFFGILKDKKRLMFFALTSLSLIIIGSLIKRRRKKKQLTVGESFVHGFGHFVFFTGLKLGAFYFFFSAEITPVWRVIQETYS